MPKAICVRLITEGPDAAHGPRWMVWRAGEEGSPYLLSAGAKERDLRLVLEHVEHAARYDLKEQSTLASG